MIFRKTRSAPSTAPKMSSTDRRLKKGKRKKRGEDGERKLPKGFKTAEWRIKANERLVIVGAHLQESLSNLSGWIFYNFYSCTHPCNPFRRRAARRSKEQKKMGATERRLHKEAMARSNTAEKRARLFQEHIASGSEKARLLKG